MRLHLRNVRGMSLIEIIIVIAILMVLIGLASTNFVPTRNRVSLETDITTLVTDLRAQQIKAMAGDTQGTGSNINHGIYFQTNSYTLFRGLIYSPSDTSNSKVNLDDGVAITSSSFPSQTILFATQSGEIIGFSAGQNSLTIKNTLNNEQKTITVNKYGIAISEN
jgi:type II secretory pathway pseudopilin PulG